MKRRALSGLAGALTTAIGLVFGQPGKTMAQDPAGTVDLPSCMPANNSQSIVPSGLQSSPAQPQPRAVPAADAPPLVTVPVASVRLLPYIPRMTRAEVATKLGLPLSSQSYHDNIVNRQLSVYRPNNAVLELTRDGLIIPFGTSAPASVFDGAANTDPYAILNAKANAN